MKKVLVVLLTLFVISAWAQDIIIMKNGESINGFVYEVGNNIIYKTDTLSRVAYSISRNEVLTIFFENGKQENINNIKNQQTTSKTINQKEVTGETIIKDLKIKKNAAIFSTVFFGVSAVTFGIIGGAVGEPGFAIAGISCDVAFMISLPAAIVNSVKYNREKGRI